MELNELIRIENYGRQTHLFICGIDFSSDLKELGFSQMKENMHEPTITMTINIQGFRRRLKRLTPEELTRAKEILKIYVDGVKRSTAEDGSTSYEPIP